MDLVFFIFHCLILLLKIISTTGTFASCIHGGAKYQDGDYFPPNNTLIKTEDPRQCVQCRCHRGLVICEIENCTQLDCKIPIKHPKFCCQRCPESLINEEPSNFLFTETSPKQNINEKSNSDCSLNGKHFEDGSVWQPVIGPFGIMACVQCRCKKGNVICSRLQCKNLPCSHPKREFGECCPVCPLSDLKVKSKAICLPQMAQFFVFKTPNVQNYSQVIEYVFVENKLNEKIAKIHSWNLRSKIPTDVFTLKILTDKEFHRKKWQILGTTTRNRFKIYSKREKKLRSRCHSKCLRRILRMEKTLEIVGPTIKKSCAKNEINLSDI